MARCEFARHARPRVMSGECDCLADADGFVDTGDMVELRGDRYYFVGRREGVINVGGLKVQQRKSRRSLINTRAC